MHLDFFLDPDIKFYFLHVHKNAGTTVKDIFIKKFGYFHNHIITSENIEKFCETNQFNLSTVDHNIAKVLKPKQLSIYLNEKKSLKDQYDKINVDLNKIPGFVVLRHPYYRARSIYYQFMKQVYRKDLASGPWFQVLDRFSFIDFLKFHEMKEYDFHTIQQHKYFSFLPNINNFFLDEINITKLVRDVENFMNSKTQNKYKLKNLNIPRRKKAGFSKLTFLQKYTYKLNFKSLKGFIFNENPNIINFNQLLNDETKKKIYEISKEDFKRYNFKP